MEGYWLCFTLLSDATFGRGEGLAGLIDQEVAQDRDGLPYLHGRTLKGLLNEECANILFALERGGVDTADWQQIAQRLFGGPGSTLADDATMRVGAARLPQDLRDAVAATVNDPHASLRPADVLDSLTTIRRQTAVDEQTGVPDESTLRTMRVILRQTPFEARLTFSDAADERSLRLLAACTVALRRAGTGRNRGRGRLQATLHADAQGRPGTDITLDHFRQFAQEVTR